MSDNQPKFTSCPNNNVTPEMCEPKQLAPATGSSREIIQCQIERLKMHRALWAADIGNAAHLPSDTQCAVMIDDLERALLEAAGMAEHGGAPLPTLVQIQQRLGCNLSMAHRVKELIQESLGSPENTEHA